MTKREGKTRATCDGPGERTAARLGYRSGYCGRSLITRAGTLELRVRRIGRGVRQTDDYEHCHWSPLRT
jgi:transposase-like protein